MDPLTAALQLAKDPPEEMAVFRCTACGTISLSQNEHAHIGYDESRGKPCVWERWTAWKEDSRIEPS